MSPAYVIFVLRRCSVIVLFRYTVVIATSCSFAQTCGPICVSSGIEATSAGSSVVHPR
jgi:hypothetical protein